MSIYHYLEPRGQPGVAKGIHLRMHVPSVIDPPQPIRITITIPAAAAPLPGATAVRHTLHVAPVLSQTHIEMSGAVGDTIVFGPDYYTDTTGSIISNPGEYVQPLSVEVVTRSAPSTALSTLPLTFSRSFQDEANEVGSATLSYDNTDTAAASALQLDRMINYKVYGRRAFSMLVESKQRATVAEGEEYDQITVVNGRGHLSITEEAVLYPSRGVGILPIEEDRTFNWSTPTPVYDHSGWGYAKQITNVGYAQLSWPHLPFAEGWPDSQTGVIWAHSGSTTYAPAGYCYFRKNVTFPSDGFYLFYAACDNEGELWLDGQQVLDLGGFTSTFEYLVYVTAGQHTIAVRGLNYTANLAGDGQGPAGLIVAIYTTDTAGEPDELIARSDSSWRIVAYPDSPPGMYVGEVLHIVFDEAQERGVLNEVQLMFGPRLDSAGKYWPETLDIASKVGTSYLTFLIEQTAAYVDLWMKPGTFKLYAWNKGSRKRLSGVTLHGPTDPEDPTTGNLYEQSHTVLI